MRTRVRGRNAIAAPPRRRHIRRPLKLPLGHMLPCFISRRDMPIYLLTVLSKHTRHSALDSAPKAADADATISYRLQKRRATRQPPRAAHDRKSRARHAMRLAPPLDE